MADLYDRIGTTYTTTRREDPRIARQIERALGDVRSVVNVGAGTGSYEPATLETIAVEPSEAMIRGRASRPAPVIRAVAEDLPFADAAFDAALAILTIHHWRDPARGLTELKRVVRKRVVILTLDPASDGFWLVENYFPEFLERDRIRIPRLDALEAVLGPIDVQAVPIPHDCEDGFLGAYWRRPEAYLDPVVRSGISSFAECRDLSALERLRADLDSGSWARTNAGILEQQALDAGYRLVIATRKD